MSTSPIISLHDVSKQYSLSIASGVSNISLEIEEGKLITIIGESGSGKSTLLKLIYGLVSPNSGKVFFQDKLIVGPEEKLIPGHDQMKMVTQDFNLNTYAKVYDNIASMLPSTNLKAKRDKSYEVMELLNISHLAEKRAADLSGGEQQRVAIARAIVTEPKVLLLDEPFSQLDALLKSQLRSDLRHLCRDLGITILLVSHDPADGLTLADELVILRQGSVIEKGAPRMLFNHPKHPYTAQLLGNCNIISCNDARSIGIETEKAFIAIYPDWLRIKNDPRSSGYVIRDSYYKGFFEELVLEKNGIRLRALNISVDSYPIGSTVTAYVCRFLEFDNI